MRRSVVVFLCLFAAPPALADAVPWLSGGVGEEERSQLQARAAEFNLRLVFAQEGSGHYLSGVALALDDAAGVRVLSAVADGPLFFARLPAGRYRLTFAAGGTQRTRAFDIAPGTPLRLHLYLP